MKVGWLWSICQVSGVKIEKTQVVTLDLVAKSDSLSLCTELSCLGLELASQEVQFPVFPGHGARCLIGHGMGGRHNGVG